MSTKPPITVITLSPPNYKAWINLSPQMRSDLFSRQGAFMHWCWTELALPANYSLGRPCHSGAKFGSHEPFLVKSLRSRHKGYQKRPLREMETAAITPV